MSSKTNFVIFCTVRTGSNLFKNLLNSHPQIFCDTELFNSRIFSDQHPLIRHFIPTFPTAFINYKKILCKKNIYGFKLISMQLENTDLLIQKLSDKGWKFFHLQRKNILKQVFSWIIAEETDQWVRWENHAAPQKTYTLDAGEVIKKIEEIKKTNALEDTVMQKVNHMKIIYEDDLIRPDLWAKTANKAFEYLNTYPAEVSPKNKITDPRKDSERIENFEEILQHLIQNNYAELVEEYHRQ